MLTNDVVAASAAHRAPLRLVAMQWIWGEVLLAARSIVRAPLFTAMVVTTLALGLGVNAAMVSMLDRLFVRPPDGVSAAANITRLYANVARPSEPGGRVAIDDFKYTHYEALIDAVGAAHPLAAYAAGDSVLIEADSARVALRRAYVSASYFRVLGVRAELGRFMTTDEDRIDSSVPVAILSHTLWQRLFGESPGALGRPLIVNGQRYTVIGVAANAFRGIDIGAVDLWVPLGRLGDPVNAGGTPWYRRANHSLRIISRLSGSGDAARIVTAGTAVYRNARLRGVVTDSTATVVLGPIAQAAGPMSVRPEFTVAIRLAVGSLILLLASCANVLNLLLLRGTYRRREIAVRRALGAPTAAIWRTLLLESVLLSLLGGCVGVFVAVWSGSTIRYLLLPRVQWAGGAVDGRTLLFILGASVVIGLATGVVSAASAARVDTGTSLAGRGGTQGGERSHVRSALLVMQAAVAVVLVVGAALFGRSLRNVQAIPIGYDAENVTMIEPLFTDQGRHDDAMRSTMPLVAALVAKLDGVQAVGYTSVAPMQGVSYEPLYLPDRDSLPKFAGDPDPTVRAVSPSYFAAAGMTMIAGREFRSDDRPGSARVVIVSAGMARAYWPGERAIGKCLILLSRENPCSTVVGIVGDAHRVDVIEPPVMQYYVPIVQTRYAPEDLVVKTAPGRDTFVRRQADQIFRQTFPGFSGIYARRIAEVVAPQLRPWRLGAMLFLAFGALALLVASVGVYSVVAYSVSQRAHEFSVRLALGARPGDVVDAALRQGLALVGVGIGIGIALSLALGRLIASLLFGVTPTDPTAMLVAAGVVLACALVATGGPAWRAARSDPAQALRSE